MYSEEDVDKYYGKQPDLAYKLKALLRYLPDLLIPENQIWQGDFLFDKASLFHNDEYWGFHPNTIVYKVKKDSELGEKIDKAEVGVVWHTRYRGDSLENIRSSFDISIDELNQIPEVFMTDPYIKSLAGIVTFTEEESQIVKDYLLKLKDYINEIKLSLNYRALIENENLTSLFSIYQNSLIRQNKKVENTKQFIEGFILFIDQRYKKEIDTKKTEASKKLLDQKRIKLIDDIVTNKETMELISSIIINITNIKHLFIKKLNKIGQFETKLKMKSGEERETSQEGFALSDSNSNVIKLVDRSEFSFANFSTEVLKGWQKA